MSRVPRIELVASQGPTPNFNRLASIYRWMEWLTFGPLLHHCRVRFLGELAERRRALIFGDGDGRFTAALLRANAAIEVDAIDASAAMLVALKQRAGADGARVEVHWADARAWRMAESSYDATVTHFFLDCLTSEEIGARALRVRGAMAPNAVWLISDFAIPPGRFGRLVARPVVRLLYLAFGVLTGLVVRELADHTEALRNAGFVLTCRRKMLLGLLVSEVWKLNCCFPLSSVE